MLRDVHQKLEETAAPRNFVIIVISSQTIEKPYFSQQKIELELKTIHCLLR